MNTSLLVGNEVFKLLSSTSFVNQWNRLATETPWFTHLQEAKFVIPWYNIYRTQYIPVLAIMKNNEGGIVAMMCLAFEKKKRILTHAGHDNCEYHGWLTKVGYEEEFLINVVQQVNYRYQLKNWNWRWVSPGLSLNTFKKIKVKGVYIGLEKRASLIWNLLDQEKLQKLRKSRSIKSKFNKLKRRGKLEFRIVTDEKETAGLLDIVKNQSDFRQEAINDSRPFHENPNKIEFSLARQRNNIVHVSGLWLDSRLIAFHLGIKEGKKVYLGTSSYDPSESKFSPGTLLMIRLAESLTDSGYEVFDLTPGTDSYKERFANSKQYLFRPTFYFSPTSKAIGRVKKFSIEFFYKFLHIFGLKISEVLYKINELQDFIRACQGIGLSGIVHNFIHEIYSKKELYIYHILESEEECSATNSSKVCAQNYEDLLLYVGTSPWQNRRELLKDAIHKFGKGESLFTTTQNDNLHWFGWFTITNKPVDIKGFSCEYIPENTERIMYDFFHEKKMDDDLFLQKVLDSCLMLEYHDIPFTILSFRKFSNSVLSKKFERFTHHKTITCIKLFGKKIRQSKFSH